MELPAFNARALREGRPLRWAVLAPGEIAADFTRTLHENSSHRVVAVGSRSPGRARAFASRFGDELAGDEHGGAAPGVTTQVRVVSRPRGNDRGRLVVMGFEVAAGHEQGGDPV